LTVKNDTYLSSTITMPKCLRERKHAKEHDAKKERKQWALRCPPREKTMGISIPASENKIAHTLRSIFNIRERVMIKRSTKEIKINSYTCTISI
jgi:hypothetical protein